MDCALRAGARPLPCPRRRAAGGAPRPRRRDARRWRGAELSALVGDARFEPQSQRAHPTLRAQRGSCLASCRRRGRPSLARALRSHGVALAGSALPRRALGSPPAPRRAVHLSVRAARREHQWRRVGRTRRDHRSAGRCGRRVEVVPRPTRASALPRAERRLHARAERPQRHTRLRRCALPHEYRSPAAIRRRRLRPSGLGRFVPGGLSLRRRRRHLQCAATLGPGARVPAGDEHRVRRLRARLPRQR